VAANSSHFALPQLPGTGQGARALGRV
jgi:hypothetical protein